MKKKINLIRKKPVIKYSGSLIQQNHGESVTEHGYILWDLNVKSSSFIKIPNDYGYYTLELNGDTAIIDEASDMPKKCRLRIKAHDVSTAKLNELIVEIKQKYNPAEITINRINKTLNDKNLTESFELPDVHDVNCQNDLIEQILIYEPQVTTQDIEEVKKINIEINSRIEIEDIIRNSKWNPLKFEWSNMFSYGENNVIDFSKLKGIVGLFAPNSTGKSSLVDSLSFCLFDKTARDFKPVNILNNKKNNFVCKLDFELSNTQYTITRKVHKNKKGDPQYKLEFTAKDDKIITSLNGENRWDTNKSIFSKIGIYEDFTLTSLSAQNKGSGFIDKGHSERKDLIIQFMGLGIFDKLYVIALDEIKQLTTLIKALSLENWDSKLNSTNKEIKILSKTYKEVNLKRDSILENIVEIRNLITFLKYDLIEIDEDLDIDELNNTLLYLTTDLDKQQGLLDNNQLNITSNATLMTKSRENILLYESLNIESMYADYIKTVNNRDKLLAELTNLEYVLNTKQDKMKKLTELEYDPDCTFCMNNIFVKDAIETKAGIEIDSTQYEVLKINVNAMKEIIVSNYHIKEKYSEYNTLKQNYALYELKKHQLELAESKINNEIESIKTNIVSIKEKIQKYESNKISIEKNRNVQCQIDENTILLKDAELVYESINQEILKIYGKIEVEKSNKHLFIDNINKLNDYNTKLEHYRRYVSCIKRDGIPYTLIQKIIPIIETEINNILSQIVEFSIMINLDDSKNINMFIVYDENNYWPLELAGGMEKFISSIAIRVALTNISNLPRSNFLIIDEGWGTLDGENLSSISMLMDYLKTQFDFVLIISHIDQIKDVADILIDIKKENGYSLIRHI